MPEVPLLVGGRGEEVARFQADLLRLGLDVPAAETERRYFGPATRRAVLGLQSAYGLPATGVADAATLAVAAAAPPAALSSLALIGDDEVMRPRAFRAPADVTRARRPMPSDGQRRIGGSVHAPAGQRAEDLTVEAVAPGFRGTRVLGSATVHAGRFEIVYAWPGGGDLAVSLRVVGADDQELLATGVRRQAAADLDWDLVLPGASPYGLSEWEYLTATLPPLLGAVAPGDLRPPDRAGDRAGGDDLSVLAGEAGVEFDAVAAWATSARLATRSIPAGAPIPAEVLYAFLRQGLPLPLTAPLLRNLQAADGGDLVASRLLERLGAMDAGAQQAMLARAVADNLAPPTVIATEVIDALQVLRMLLAGRALVGGRSGLAEMLELTERARHTTPAILDAWSRHTGTTDAFWDELVAAGTIDQQTAHDIRQTIALATITRNHQPLVRELARRMQRGEIASLPDLARLSRAQWQAILASEGPDGTRIGTPSKLDGETAAEREELYAAILDRELERRYPTPSFAAKLGRSERSPLPAGAAVAAFLTANPDIDLARTRVDHVLADRPETLDGVADPVALRRDLKAAQRVFKLAPTHDAVETLLMRGLDSARKIAAMGEAPFVEALRGTPVDAMAARDIHRRATTASALALTMLGSYNRALDGVRPAALPPALTSAEVTAGTAALPDLQTLFGSFDACACPGCRSVTSPAAYFVDILRFLGERAATGATDAAAVLLQRRPDLGEIELSCANTETELPYIDLVNEILEDAVAPPRPAALHGVTVSSLAAGPASAALLGSLAAAGITIGAGAQVTGPDSRGRWAVRDSDATWSLLVDGTSLAALRTRQTTRATAELLALPEYLNNAAYTLLAGAIFPFDLPFDLPFLETRTYLAHLGVDQPQFLRLFQQAGLEPLSIVPLTIGPDGRLILSGDDLQVPFTSPTDEQIGCTFLSIPDTEHRLLNGTLGTMPWEAWGLTEQVAGAGTWVDALAPVDALADRAGLTYSELLQLLDMHFVDPGGGLSIAPRPGADPDTCDRSQLVVRGLTAEKLDRAQRFLRLWRRLGCAMWDLDKVLRLGGGDDLTRLAELERLRRRTGLDWPTVLALFGDIEHLPYVDRSQDDAPAVQTLYQRLFRNPLVATDGWLAQDPERLTGQLSDHVPALLAAFGLDATQLTLILQDFGEDTSALLTLQRLSGIFRRGALARAVGLPVEEFEALLGMWERDPFGNPEAANQFLDLVARVVASPFSIAELDYLLRHRVTLGPAVGIDDRTIAALLGDVAAAMAAPLAAAATEADDQPSSQPAGADDLVAQKVAPVVGLDVPTAAVLLDHLAVPAGARTLRAALGDPRLAAARSAGAALDEQRFPDAYAAARLLHKGALLARKFGLRAAEVAWWIADDHAARLDWLHPTNLPVASSSARSLGRWDAMQQFAAFAARVPPGPLRAFDLVAGLLADDGDANPAALLARFTSWGALEIDALTTAFGWLVPVQADPRVPDPSATPARALRDNLLSARNLLRLADCFAVLRRLGVGAARALSWATAAPDRATADSLRQTVKAKYDLAQWEEVAQPLQDTLREQRRDALASWLVARPDSARGQDWTDAAGLYGHFLIDVEMGACMRTSRIKQAAASAQLFVQRCLLSLEPAVPADPKPDPKWQQWTWMKRYRTWEANRQIFLYPENWLEPELRHEKSPMFRQLERELLQTDLTAEAAEQAYRAYLERLAAVANLEIRALAYAPRTDRAADLHVIGRGRGRHGATYYYRRQIGLARWTPWEEIGVDIAGDHVVAGLDNDRLQLFWPQFLDKAAAPAQLMTPSPASFTPVVPPARHWEVRLNWSTYQGDTWTTKVLGQAPLLVYDWAAGTDPANVQFRQLAYQVVPPGVKVELLTSPDPARYPPEGNELYLKTGSQLVVLSNFQVGPRLDATIAIQAPPEAQYTNGLILHNSSTLHFGFGEVRVIDTGFPTGPVVGDSVAVLRRISPNTTFTVLRSDAWLPPPWFDHAFVCDEARTFHVDYRRTQVVSSTRGTSTNPVYVSTWSLRFSTHYHPFVDAFIATFDAQGRKGLFDREVQLQTGPFDFLSYAPDLEVVDGPLPVEDVNFFHGAAYAPYNWELFFHVPMLIGNRLAAEQRYEEALRWYQGVFDPTATAEAAGADPATPQQRFWITKPFYLTSTAQYRKQRIEAVLQTIAAGDPQLLQQVEEWQADAFNPHLIAQLRTVAYQKYVVVRYVQTLIAWGDQLFRENTIESLNEATQLYVLAASLLGPRPQTIARRAPAVPQTYYQLASGGLEPIVESLTEVENLLPVVPSGIPRDTDAADPPQLPGNYFCVSGNDRLFGLWDTAADRLFKLRHCQNIEGQIQQLPLFEPPIDPALVAKAVAAGVDIGAAIDQASAPRPLYRFRSQVARARELCAQVRALGAALLAALEKRDAEALALLRSEHELAALTQIRLVKAQQVNEALRARAAYAAARTVAETRVNHYAKLISDGVNANEQASLDETTDAQGLIVAASVAEAVGGALALIPNLDAGATGVGGSPTAKAKFGGDNLARAAAAAAGALKGLASIQQIKAGRAATLASYARRAEDWELQRQIAVQELIQIDQQIAAADLRHAIAVRELANHDLQMQRAAVEDDYLRSRFTRQELYGWMITQLSTVYQQTYQLAHDLARQAEACYRDELGLGTPGEVPSEIHAEAWDGLRQGLLAGERLSLDVERLEAAFERQNLRRFELTKHVSLAQLDPVALLQLRQNGTCMVDIPEAVFDLDYPGHYFRRLRGVEVTVPCVAGPYTTVACTLTLLHSSVRTDARVENQDDYARRNAADPRFDDESGFGRSIATSSGQHDAGLFADSARDDRYLPFEGAGAISSWTIRINNELPQIDLTTITDVILHLEYTARDGGDELRKAAVKYLRTKLGDLELAGHRQGLFRVFDLKREFPDQWHRFRQPAPDGGVPEFALTGLRDRLPLFTSNFQTVAVRQLQVAAHLTDPAAAYDVQVAPLGGPDGMARPLAADTTFTGLVHALFDLSSGEVPLGPWTIRVRQRGSPDSTPLPPDAIDELFLIVNYTLTGSQGTQP